MEQGELDGQYNDWASTKARDLEKIQSGQWLTIGQLTEKPLQDLPNVPMILAFAKNDEQRQLLRYGLIVPNLFTRLYFMAPGVPEDRVAAMETAFAKAMADKEFLAEAEKAKLDIAPTTGADIKKLVTEYLAMPADLKGKLEKVIPSS